jgi:hypothetical protein
MMTITTLSAVLFALLSILSSLPPAVAAFQCHRPRQTQWASTAGSSTLFSRSRRTAIATHGSTLADEEESVVPSFPKLPLLPIASLAAACIICAGFPQLADAAGLFENDLSANGSIGIVQQQEQDKEPRTTAGKTTYASQGLGGLDFLSTFQTPGTTPPPMDPKFDSKEARNKAFDDAFEQDARERDAYYGKMALLKREKIAAELQDKRTQLGLEGNDDAGPRFGDDNVASMASLKKYLLEKDPATMSPAEFKEYQILKIREN